jgi:hypothetical protein
MILQRSLLKSFWLRHFLVMPKPSRNACIVWGNTLRRVAQS